MSEFEHTYFKFTKQAKQDMTLPDSVMAFMLLASCNLSDNEQQLVMSAISEISLKNMKGALGRSVQSAKPINKPVMCDVKSEPVLLGGGRDEFDADGGTNESMFVRGSQRGRFRSSVRGYRPRGRFVPRGATRRQNPLGPDGRISRCMVCDSRFHWARECPDAYENMENYSCSSAGSNNTGGTSAAVNFSLFAGYANGERENKLSKLVEEAKCCAVLDSGCSTTVCGVKGLDEFLSACSDFEHGSLVEEESKATFTFADGVTVPSLKCVTVPCSIVGIKGNIKTDVVDCNIPLLLSKKSMKKANMVVNFGTDQVTVYGRHMDLNTSLSGHYLLPLSD